MEKLKNFLFLNISPRQIVFKNTFWLYFSEGLSKGLRLLVFIFITRILGPENYGFFEYLFSFVGLFFLFADFGISNIFIRDYQQKEDKEKILNVFYSLKIFLSSLFSLIAFLGFLFLKNGTNDLSIYFLIVIFYFLTNIESFFEVYFVAVQKVEKKFIFNFISSLFLVLSIVVGLNIYKNVFSVVIAYLLSAIASLTAAYFIFKKETKVSFCFDKKLVLYYFFNGLPLAFFGLLGFIFFSTDKIILAYFKKFEEVGYYSLASRIISVLFIFPSLFNTAFFPYLSKKVIEKNIRLKILKLFKIITTFSILFGLFLAIFVLLMSPLLVSIFFGLKYLPSVEILNKFVWIIIFIFPTTFLDYFLLSFHKQWLNFLITLIPSLLNIILNLFLIPIYGVFGAVYASLISQFLNFVLTFFVSLTVIRKIDNNML